MNLDSKIILCGAFICLADAIALLFYFDSVAGFFLGCFGFAIGLLSSAIVSEVK